MARRRRIVSTSRVVTVAAIAVPAKAASAQSQAPVMAMMGALACSRRGSSVSDPAQRPLDHGAFRTDLAGDGDLLVPARLAALAEIDAFFELGLMIAAGGAEAPATAAR